jgi:hypothetical protein
VDVIETIVEIDALLNRHELELACLPVLEDQMKGKHGVLRTKWMLGLPPGIKCRPSVTG